MGGFDLSDGMQSTTLLLGVGGILFSAAVARLVRSLPPIYTFTVIQSISFFLAIAAQATGATTIKLSFLLPPVAAFSVLTSRDYHNLASGSVFLALVALVFLILVGMGERRKVKSILKHSPAAQ